jgi:hypothetical protein
MLEPVPSINVIQHKKPASDGRVELDVGKEKRDFRESDLEMWDFEHSAPLLGRRNPCWWKDINGECLHLMQPVGNTDDAVRQPAVLN